MTAIYTAYLFAQSKARDLWQNPLLPAHFLVQSVFAGGAVLLLLDAGLPALAASGTAGLAGVATLVALTGAAHLLLVLGELTLTHATAHARLAAHHMLAGRFAAWFWLGVAGVAGAAGLAAFAPPGLAGAGPITGALALAGLFAHEHAHVQAAQSVPLA